MEFFKKIEKNKYPYFIAEIGLNHNGEVKIAKELIDVAVSAKCDAVKFQKRTPELCVPEDQKMIERDTPWGIMSYIDYRHRIEFGEDEYAQIDEYCSKVGIDWFVSTWDKESVDFMEEKLNANLYKVPSACITDTNMLNALNDSSKPIIMSTGMSTIDEIKSAVSFFNKDNLAILHCTSSYPCSNEEINLNMIPTLKEMFPNNIIGYSGHETGLQVTLAAVALGSKIIERHITLDRTMWGSDQSASLEPHGLRKLIRDIYAISDAMGDGKKIVYDSELSSLKKLRRFK